MRYLGVAILIALTAAAVAIPAPGQQAPGDDLAVSAPPVAVCALLEAGERGSSAIVLSSVVAPGRLIGLPAGSTIDEIEFVPGSAGSVSIDASEIGAVGAAGGLIELPSETSAAGVVIESATSIAAESCGQTGRSPTFVSGGSTAGDDGFVVQLLNPYAGDAAVSLSVVTDAGIEPDERFDSVRVPASGTRTLDFGEIVPGRALISVDLATTEGSVLAVARQTRGEDIATWNAVEPAQDWWLPVPSGGETKELVLASPANAAIDYQIDFYGPNSFVEGYATGSLGSGDVARISLTDDTTEASGLRVISTGPVVPTLWIDSDAAGLAVTTATAVDATTWLLPGAGSQTGGSGAVVILNSGLETVSITVRALGDRAFIREEELAPEGTLSVSLAAADGYRVESSGPVVAMWVATKAGSGAVAIGSPFADG